MWGNYVENKLSELDKNGKSKYKIENLLNTVDTTQTPVQTETVVQHFTNIKGLIEVVEAK